MSSIKSLLLTLALLLLITSSISAQKRKLNGLAIVSKPNLFTNNQNKVTTGILFDILGPIWRKLNMSVEYTTTHDIPTNANTTILQSIENSTYDFVLGYPILASSNMSQTNFDEIDKIDFIQDSVIVFTPNLLSLLVGNVMKETFFIIGIVFFPWTLINTLVFYLINKRKFSRITIVRGFIEAFKGMILHSKKMSKVSRYYSLGFYISVLVVGMFLLGDFIYVITAMVHKLGIEEDLNQFLSSESTTCIFEDDFLVQDFISRRPEISIVAKSNVEECFIGLDNLDVKSIMISSLTVQNFFYNYPKYNNKFNFFVKDSITANYHMLIDHHLHLDDDITRALSSFTADFVPGVLSRYLKSPVFNKILPSSIFSDSILCTFLSLTITSTFLILFIGVLIYKQNRKIIRRVKIHLLKTKNKERVERCTTLNNNLEVGTQISLDNRHSKYPSTTELLEPHSNKHWAFPQKLKRANDDNSAKITIKNLEEKKTRKMGFGGIGGHSNGLSPIPQIEAQESEDDMSL